MSTPGNTAKLGATHSNIQTAQRGPSLTPWLGANLQCISQHTTESALYSLCQPGMRSSEIQLPTRQRHLRILCSSIFEEHLSFCPKCIIPRSKLFCIYFLLSYILDISIYLQLYTDLQNVYGCGKHDVV